MQILHNTTWVYPAYSGKAPKGYTRNDDLIREDICIVLTIDPYVDPSQFTVEVKKGEAILEGYVSVELMKSRAGQLAMCVFGTKGVKNNLQVKAAEETQSATPTGGAVADLSNPSRKK